MKDKLSYCKKIAIQILIVYAVLVSILFLTGFSCTAWFILKLPLLIFSLPFIIGNAVLALTAFVLVVMFLYNFITHLGERDDK